MDKCPSCGEKLTISRRNIYEGFSVVGWEDKCIFCGAVTASSADKPSGEQQAAPAASRSKLSALLGETPAEKRILKAEDGEKRFCRICRHFLQHPFTPRCALDNHPVDPMEDCPEFAQQEK